MQIEEIQKRLEDEFAAAVGPVVEAVHGSWIEIDPDKIDKVCDFLKSSLELKFDCLSNLSGVDYPAKGHIQIVYNVFSYELGHELTLKVNADRETPVVATVETVWPAANWLEREVYDLLGVEFAGHSDLRRILLPEDWVGHPLRKDYVEAPEYHGISTVRESMLDIPGRS
jgi:NADH-quinone oxidoreductase subunit C